MNKQETILRSAIQAAKRKGIRIGRGPAFTWSKAGRSRPPEVVDATGAVLIEMGWLQLGPGWLKAFCAYLGVDGFWLWRFWMGWDRGYQVQSWDEGNKLWVDDEVSHFAKRLAREMVDENRGSVVPQPSCSTE